MRTIFPTIAALACFILPAGAQVTLLRDAECHGCEITFAPEVTLGEQTGPGIIESEQSRAVGNSRGQYFVVGSYGSTIKVFDASGRYVRTIGRAGDGPGEYRGIGCVVVGPNDSLFVFDQVSRRMTVLAPNGAVARTVRLGLAPELDVVRTAAGQFVVAMQIFSPAAIGEPLHVVAATGKLLRSFGSASGLYRPDVPLLVARSIAIADSNHLWSASVSNYRIDLIDLRTRIILRSMERKVPWFEDWMKPSSNDELSKPEPQPLLQSIQQDSAGHLWVLASVADPQWRSAVKAPSGDDTEYQIVDYNHYHDTIIEVIDPVRGVVLASKRVSPALTHFVANHLVGGVVEDANDIPRLQVWKVHLVVP